MTTERDPNWLKVVDYRTDGSRGELILDIGGRNYWFPANDQAYKRFKTLYANNQGAALSYIQKWIRNKAQVPYSGSWTGNSSSYYNKNIPSKTEAKSRSTSMFKSLFEKAQVRRQAERDMLNKEGTNMSFERDVKNRVMEKTADPQQLLQQFLQGAKSRGGSAMANPAVRAALLGGGIGAGVGAFGGDSDSMMSPRMGRLGILGAGAGAASQIPGVQQGIKKTIQTASSAASGLPKAIGKGIGSVSGSALQSPELMKALQNPKLLRSLMALRTGQPQGLMSRMGRAVGPAAGTVGKALVYGGTAAGIGYAGLRGLNSQRTKALQGLAAIMHGAPTNSWAATLQRIIGR